MNSFPHYPLCLYCWLSLKIIRSMLSYLEKAFKQIFVILCLPFNLRWSFSFLSISWRRWIADIVQPTQQSLNGFWRYDLTIKMQGPYRHGHSRKTHYSGPYKIPLPVSAACLSVISEITKDRTVVVAEPKMCLVLFEKNKSNLADTHSLQRDNQWSRNWMWHTLFTWISVF